MKDISQEAGDLDARYSNYSTGPLLSLRVRFGARAVSHDEVVGPITRRNIEVDHMIGDAIEVVREIPWKGRSELDQGPRENALLPAGSLGVRRLLRCSVASHARDKLGSAVS